MAAPRVLVVDDSSFMRSRICQCLRSAGMEVVGQAGDGGEAATQYERLRPDAVTMDLTMRGQDGLAGTRLIREIDEHAKIVVFSIIEDPSLIESLRASGVRAFVHKSCPEELVRCLQELTALEAT